MLLLTCEHGGNQIPVKYEKNFKAAGEILKTHRGLDIGALKIAQLVQKKLNVDLVFSATSRLVVDLNRSLKSPTLFSEYTKFLTQAEKQQILKRHYFPHWSRIRKTVKNTLAKNRTAVHIAMHSMTDQLNGQKRRMHLALLYNPTVKEEVRFASLWIKELRLMFPYFIIARNKPYRGDNDGVTVEMRKENKNYIGIELEMNQALLLEMNARQKKHFSNKLARSLEAALSTFEKSMKR